MEGTWGRRIFGRIWTENGLRWFRLEMEIPDREAIIVQITATLAELDRYPSTYKHILDQMTYELEKAWNRTNNTP